MIRRDGVVHDVWRLSIGAAHELLVSGIVEKGQRNGLRRLGSRGVLAAWIADSIPADGGTTRPRTALLGVLGALFGGVVAWLLDIGSVATFFHPGAWLVALGGAAALLAIHGLLADR